jgi:hypothetical protein
MGFHFYVGKEGSQILVGDLLTPRIREVLKRFERTIDEKQKIAKKYCAIRSIVIE